VLRWRQTNEILNKCLYGFSVYIAPLAIGLLSIAAWTSWTSQYPLLAGTPVQFRVVKQTDHALTPADAKLLLGKDTGPVSYEETHLSEEPFWFRFDIDLKSAESGSQIELPSRHARQIDCWDATSLEPIGTADRIRTTGRLRPAKAGFELDVGQFRSAQDILCRASFVGPAQISVVQWNAGDLTFSILEDHHRSGLLDGGLLMLAAFVLLVAVVNKEWTYVLFAAWLVTNLRLAGLSTGWDTQWLNHQIPQQWVYLLRKLTISSYYVLTYAIFVRLFSEDLRRVGFSFALNLAQWFGVVLIVAALLLPYATYLPLMWGIVAIGTIILVALLVRILTLTRSAVASWYAASIAITLLSGFAEVVAAALGIRSIVWIPNSVTAAASSSLMAALAIAAQMREERRERVRAQAELRDTYNALPIGLFTTNLTGDFLRYNPALQEMLWDQAARNTTEHRWQDYFGAEAWELLRLVAQEGGGDIEVHGRQGTAIAAKTFHAKATISGGRIEGSMQDVTDRAKATERLEYLAEYDPLTNVLNTHHRRRRAARNMRADQGGTGGGARNRARWR